MSNQRIIFFDIDGTLLDSNKQLPDSTKRSIEQLKRDGHIVAIATGRAPFMFHDLLQELELDTYVSYNGQYVVLKNEVIFTNPLQMDSLVDLTKEALERKHPVVFMDHEDMKANVPEHPYIDESFLTLKIKQHPTYDPHYYQGRNLYQSLLFCEEGEEVYYENKYKDFHFIRWHPLSVDIVPSDGSKAVGISKMIDLLNIDPANVYAFGDGLNDMDMLENVENSIAMGNALDEVKAKAKYITKSVDEEGIYHGLKAFGLL